MYEVFEHTADLGLRIEAGDLPALFSEAARGLFSMIVEDLETVVPASERVFQLAGTDQEYLLFDWLNELLYTFETELLLLCHFEVHLEPNSLKATARGELFNSARHHLAHEVKAITYHQLSVRQIDAGWRAEVIVDI